MWNFTSDYCSEITRVTEELIEHEGYPLEKHSVVTEDGYINCMYRIPHGKDALTSHNSGRPPVLLLHGFTGSCAMFINQSCLAYYLVDQGFDVWLPNSRGTTFSRKHATLDLVEQKDKYWNFSFHEIGVYDIAAFVDHILQCTGFEKLFFIGHSQGASSYAVLCSERPKYNRKIAICCMLAPAFVFEKSATLTMKFATRIIVPCLEFFHTRFKLPLNEAPFTNLQRFLGAFAKYNILIRKFILSTLFLIGGNPDFEQTSEIDATQLSLTMPDSASLRQVFHFCQIMRSNRFSKYDYGPRKNMELYGLEQPPLYELSKITSPVALFYGENDMYTHPEDMEKLEQMMGNVVHKHLVENKLFNHLDFVLAKDSINLVYIHLLSIMQKYIPKKIS